MAELLAQNALPCTQGMAANNSSTKRLPLPKDWCCQPPAQGLLEPEEPACNAEQRAQGEDRPIFGSCMWYANDTLISCIPSAAWLAFSELGNKLTPQHVWGTNTKACSWGTKVSSGGTGSPCWPENGSQDSSILRHYSCTDQNVVIDLLKGEQGT